MSIEKVDAGEARKKLEAAWAKIDDPKTAAPEPLLSRIHELLTAKDVTFKYILVTGLLGKLTNPAVHPRALQAGSTLTGAYDARSLCHSVIVTFEKPKGNLFGLSNEPFLNKPARHAEHSKGNTQLKNKRLAIVTHDILEAAAAGTPSQVEAMLVSALRVARKMAASQVFATVDVESNLRHVIRFVEQFLTESDGGAHLAAVTGAFVTLLSENYTVKVYPPNNSDKFAKTWGDIEVFSEDDLLSAFECKDRPLTLDDVRHGLKKAREKGIPEYCYVCGAGMVEDAAIRAEIAKAAEDMDASLLNIQEVLRPWAIALNPGRRAEFGNMVTALLRDSMRRRDPANAAATLWNSLK